MVVLGRDERADDKGMTMHTDLEPTTVRRSEPRLPRVDLYGAVHKGLRYALSSLLTRMGAADFNDCARVAALLDDLDGVLYLVESHIAHEDRHVHPAIERKAPGASLHLMDEHRAHERAIEELRGLMTAMGAGRPGAGPAIGRQLYLTYSRFVAESLLHMLDEESVMEPLLEGLYTTEELTALHDAIVASIGPDEMLAFTRVMVPANGTDVRVAMLSGAKTAMPLEAFARLLRSFRPLLDEGEWRDLTTRLGVAA